MVYTRSGLISKKANECKIGDWVLSPRQIETTNCSPIFLKYKQKLINKFTKQSFSSIKLTSEFAYFLGWCVAEGCSKTTNYQLTTGWKFNDAKKILYLYRKLFKSLSGYILKSTPKQANKHCMYIRGRKIVAKKNNYRVVLGGGTGLNELFLNLCGNGSHNKKVPECIFQSNSIIQKSFLNGYIAGDGCIRKRNKKQIISFGTVSQELAYGLQCLYQINGVSCGLYFNKKTKSFNGEISVLTKNYGKQYGVPADLLGIKSWKKKKINDIKNWKNKINLFNMHKQKDWNYNQIKKLKKYYYRGIVYDFVVPKNHTFVAGNGNILVHNSGIGKSLYSHLINKYKDNAQSFIPVDFNSVIEIGFKKDTNGKFITDKNGKHVLETVSTVDWSVQQLKDIFYNKKIECYEDTKFDAQINNIISQRSKQGKILYDCKGENHLFQAFQVFAISHWITEFKQLQPIKRNKPGLGSFGSKQ
jgi:intein/homing endonuclease